MTCSMKGLLSFSSTFGPPSEEAELDSAFFTAATTSSWTAWRTSSSPTFKIQLLATIPAWAAAEPAQNKVDDRLLLCTCVSILYQITERLVI